MAKNKNAGKCPKCGSAIICTDENIVYTLPDYNDPKKTKIKWEVQCAEPCTMVHFVTEVREANKNGS